MKKQEFKKNEKRLGNLWGNLKHSNIPIIGMPEEKRKSKKLKTYLKNNEGELSQFGKGNRLSGSPGSSESSKEVVPKEEHTKAHHNYISQIKDKERILKAAREKETVTYKEVSIRLSADFSEETLQARRGWKEVFQVMKGKDLHPRLLYPAKLSFRMEAKIKCFSDKVKLKEFIITKPLLHEMLKGLI